MTTKQKSIGMEAIRGAGSHTLPKGATSSQRVKGVSLPGPGPIGPSLRHWLDCLGLSGERSVELRGWICHMTEGERELKQRAGAQSRVQAADFAHLLYTACRAE